MPVPKKGDQLEVDNYRGIGLMTTVSKLVALMVTRRLQAACEEANVLPKSQAGFRSGEGCAGQVAALVEACQRRAVAGRATWLLFVDFAKAYDSVPHDRLLAKLRALGMRGRMLGYVTRLLTESRMRVRVGGHAHAEAFAVRTGVVQGCPLSPLLFLLFVADLDAALSDEGVEVHVSAARAGLAPEPPLRMSNLAFADDVVVLANGRSSIARCLTVVAEWAQTNGMSLNIKPVGADEANTLGAKTALMTIGRPAEERARLLAGDAGWRTVHGRVVPLVRRYRYLGLVLTDKLDPAVMATDRLEGLKRRVAALMPYLCDRRMPVDVRLEVVRTVLFPMAMYGGDVLGAQPDYLHGATRCLERALRAVFGAARNAPLFTLWREARLVPVAVAAKGAMVRALHSWVSSSKTYIADLLRSVSRVRSVRAADPAAAGHALAGTHTCVAGGVAQGGPGRPGAAACAPTGHAGGHDQAGRAHQGRSLVRALPTGALGRAVPEGAPDAAGGRVGGDAGERARHVDEHVHDVWSTGASGPGFSALPVAMPVLRRGWSAGVVGAPPAGLSPLGGGACGAPVAGPACSQGCGVGDATGAPARRALPPPWRGVRTPSGHELAAAGALGSRGGSRRCRSCRAGGGTSSWGRSGCACSSCPGSRPCPGPCPCPCPSSRCRA